MDQPGLELTESHLSGGINGVHRHACLSETLPLSSVLTTGVSASFPLRPAMVVQVSDPSSWEAVAVRLEVQDCFWLHRKCEVSLGYKRPRSQKNSNNNVPSSERRMSPHGCFSEENAEVQLAKLGEN